MLNVFCIVSRQMTTKHLIAFFLKKNLETFVQHAKWYKNVHKRLFLLFRCWIKISSQILSAMQIRTVKLLMPVSLKNVRLTGIVATLLSPSDAILSSIDVYRFASFEIVSTSIHCTIYYVLVHSRFERKGFEMKTTLTFFWEK